MRKRLAMASVAFAVASILAAPAMAQSKQKLVINSYGGDYEKTHRAAVIEPFEKAYNVEVQVITAYSADALAQLRAQKAAPQYDVVHFSGGQEVLAAQEGLILPMTLEDLPMSGKDLYPFAIEGLARGEGPVHSIAAVGLTYNTERAPRKPTKWADLWDPIYKDHILFTDLSNSTGLTGFLMMNKIRGGTIQDIEPGLKAVEELLDGAVIVSTSPEVQQNFAQNDIWISPHTLEYTYTLRRAGFPIDFVQPEEGTPVMYQRINLVANRPNTELAKKFIDFSLSADVQAEWAKMMRYSPTNRAAQLPDDVANEVIYGEEEVARTIRFDPTEVNEARPEIVERWKKMIAR